MLTILEFFGRFLVNIFLPFLLGGVAGYFPGIIVLWPAGWIIGKIARFLFKHKPKTSLSSCTTNYTPYLNTIQLAMCQPQPQAVVAPTAAPMQLPPIAAGAPPPATVAQPQSSSIWNTVTTTASQSQTWYTQTQSGNASASNSARNVYDLNGNLLQLGTKDEKASGGEGTVYTMPSHSSVMIKLYKDSTLHDAVKMKEIKKRVEAMTNLSACTNAKHLAWPLLPVADDKKQMIGFAMRACSGESFRSLGSVAGITKAFPKWDRLQLAETALDFVVKVRELAKNGVMINDFNPCNFLVDQNCRVSMIDCDSYQIPDQNGNPLITHTYFASHVAPELRKNPKLMNLPRDIHHVEFGVAIVVFGLVMCGLHPYSFSDPSNRRKIGTPEENLLKGHCPFAPGSKLKFPKAPHDEWANLWSWLPTSLQDAFVATFCDGHSTPVRRASLGQLESALHDTVQVMRNEPQACELMPKKKHI